MNAVQKLKAQIRVDGGIALGPGTADLLAAIDTNCSISAAGRGLDQALHTAAPVARSDLPGRIREPG